MLKAENPAQKVEGFVFAFISILCHMWVLPCLKSLYAHNPDLTGYEVLYWKSLGNFVCLTIYSLLTEGNFKLINPYLIKDYRKMMFFRVLLGFLNYGGQFIVVFYLPVGLTICLLQIQTVITAILCYFMEGETISKWDVVGIISSLTGVMVIYNPWKKYEDKDYNYSVGILLAICVAIAAGSNMSLLRYMKKDIHYTRGPLFFYTGGMFLSPLLHFFSKRNQALASYDSKTLMLIFGKIVCSFFGHIFQSRSYQLEKGARISMVF